MALDLTLTALPAAARFALDKARARAEYAAEFDKILEPDKLRQHLVMIRRSSNGTPEALLLELLADAEQLRPLPLPEPPEFYSYSRGYATLDHLLAAWLQARGQPRQLGNYVFYSGTPLDTNGQHAYFHYLRPAQVQGIDHILRQAKFADLLGHYDYERLSEQGVYKLTRPEHLPYLEEEYAALRAFFGAAQAAEAFMLIELV
ncbi:DUF1877 family protein [Hymenobacter actinosclerus]|uniref:DUF1877 domain-containing protein n=1 Tax=Hymenobacter actinosclerus TaxID=82805 RepID=A0A1I0DSD0_9BACT|nr:DUF1877 family protein [Hymenobacter actinosclerus]SET35349.1 protein of unknown function [Hymenobacter actinosclerus]